MVTKGQKVRLGIFVVVSLLFLVLMIGSILGGKMFESRDIYYIKYHEESVNGLQVGGTVKYHGISVGRVDEIKIDENDVRNVIVTISLNEGTPIKEDVEATLAPVGITGLKSIELVGASIDSELRETETFIPSGKSTLSNITGKAEIIAEKVELLLNNVNELLDDDNRRKFDSILANTDKLIKDNSVEITGTMANIDSLTYNLATFSNQMNQSIGRINQIIESDEVSRLLANAATFSDTLITYDYVSLLNNIEMTITEIKSLSNNINLTVVKGRQDLLSTLETLTATMDYLNEFSRQISENPAVLFRSIIK